jgi:hypothetical protein
MGPKHNAAGSPNMLSGQPLSLVQLKREMEKVVTSFTKEHETCHSAEAATRYLIAQATIAAATVLIEHAISILTPFQRDRL